jgi:hypothetical protein
MRRFHCWEIAAYSGEEVYVVICLICGKVKHVDPKLQRLMEGHER